MSGEQEFRADRRLDLSTEKFPRRPDGPHRGGACGYKRPEAEPCGQMRPGSSRHGLTPSATWGQVGKNLPTDSPNQPMLPARQRHPLPPWLQEQRQTFLHVLRHLSLSETISQALPAVLDTEGSGEVIVRPIVQIWLLIPLSQQNILTTTTKKICGREKFPATYSGPLMTPKECRVSFAGVRKDEKADPALVLRPLAQHHRQGAMKPVLGPLGTEPHWPPTSLPQNHGQNPLLRTKTPATIRYRLDPLGHIHIPHTTVCCSVFLP
ncbi:uncharacterized protein LOC102162747 isoform X2 [Sus scrofa]|uniref:uncharacterized protein LOC102162747 isoform X2 n=1 Tax=Sus scrofa TaxID=9823 RepID=UPI000A2AF4BE|nr:uncharacterized protein LOC102162747 isoform X2 [Sus scrofa]